MPAFSLSFVMCSIVLVIGALGHQYRVHLDHNGQFLFEWSVDYDRSEVDIKLTAHVPPMSWFAVGFSNYGELSDADLVVIDGEETLGRRVVDAHTSSKGILIPDLHRDYRVDSITKLKQGVTVRFHRQFVTCDPKDYQLDNGTTHIVYVEPQPLNLKVIPFGINVTKLRHGVQRVQLLKPEVPKQKLPADTWTFEILAPNVTVPSKETTYWWFTTQLPEIPTSHHIIKYEGVIAKGNEDLVHHMEVFHCQVPKDVGIPFYNGPGLSEGKPKGLGVCRRVIGAWAMGAEAMVYPEEAGVAIGGPGMSRQVLLEVHYNNPHIASDRVDTSGIRFYVTSQLRRYEAGIMELGLEYTNKMAIPPKQEDFALSGYCVQECTRVGLPHEGIKIFASQLHTHLTGKRVVTKHFRRGVELPELNRDNHYSPHYQEIRRLPEPVHVKPGDALITTCHYNTMERENATVGGFSISDEMCVNYIHYYPRSSLEVCKSSVDTVSLNTFFFFMKKLKYPKLAPELGYRTNYQMVKWTSQDTKLLKTLYATSPLSMQCNQSDGTRFPGEWERNPLPFVIRSLPTTESSFC